MDNSVWGQQWVWGRGVRGINGNGKTYNKNRKEMKWKTRRQIQQVGKKERIGVKR